jgi:hypothetical protein
VRSFTDRNHVTAWLHPDAQIDAGTNFRHYAEITQTAERGKFDLMFVAAMPCEIAAGNKPMHAESAVISIGRIRCSAARCIKSVAFRHGVRGQCGMPAGVTYGFASAPSCSTHHQLTTCW